MVGGGSEQICQQVAKVAAHACNRCQDEPDPLLRRHLQVHTALKQDDASYFEEYFEVYLLGKLMEGSR